MPRKCRRLIRVLLFALAGLFVVIVALVLRDCWPHRTTHHILDSDGRIVIYHGVNVANHSKHTPDRLPTTTPEDFRQIRDWGFNLVRYLVFWEAIEPEPGKYDEEYLRQTLIRIDQLADLGIDVLLDFHQDLFAQRFGGNGFPDWAVHDGGRAFTRQTPWQNNYWQPAVWHSYDTFWRDPDLQNRYAEAVARVLRLVEDRPNVIGLDIINEPWPWKGLGFERNALTAFYDRVASVREREGLRTPLFFSPMLPTNTGLRSGLYKAPAPNSVYSIHYYDAFIDFGQPYRWWNRWLMWRAVRVKVGEAERMGVPLFVGEFGLNPNNPGFSEYLQDFTGMLEAQNVGWAYWSYDPGQFGLIKSKNQPGPALDTLVQVYAQRIAGRNPTIMRTPTSFTLAYDPIPTRAPTIIFIPQQFKLTGVRINGQTATNPTSSELRHINPDTTRQEIHLTW